MMLKVPFGEVDSHSMSDASSNHGDSCMCPLTGMKVFGAQYSEHEYSCMNQANFIAIAMERKRRRNTEEIISFATTRLTELFHSPVTSHQKRKQKSVLDILERSKVISSSKPLNNQQNAADYSPHASEIEYKDFGSVIESRGSWQEFQQFSDVLKSEAMLRRQIQL